MKGFRLSKTLCITPTCRRVVVLTLAPKLPLAHQLNVSDDSICPICFVVVVTVFIEDDLAGFTPEKEWMGFGPVYHLRYNADTLSSGDSQGFPEK